MCKRSASSPLLLGVIGALLLVLATGCSSLRPGSFASFDDWLTGDPESDYELVELEGRSPEFVLVHHYLTWPAFAVRDGLRLAAAPLVAPYFLFRSDRTAQR